MKRYIDLVKQTFDFPTDEFAVKKGALHFHGVELMDLINTFGTPLRLTYLPKISDNIQKVTGHFKKTLKKFGYSGSYTYCYCTKSSHFRFILEKTLSTGAQIETSSAYDLDIIKSLHTTNTCGRIS